jgi:hypothetical protein
MVATSESCSLCSVTLSFSTAKSLTDICDDVTENTADVIAARNFKEILMVHFWQDPDLMENLENTIEAKLCGECQILVQKIDIAEKVQKNIILKYFFLFQDFIKENILDVKMHGRMSHFHHVISKLDLLMILGYYFLRSVKKADRL